MRFLGNLPNETAALTFSNVLIASDIEHQIEKEPNVWALWIRSEEDLPKAAELLNQYLENPGARFIEAKAREGAVQRRLAEESFHAENAGEGPPSGDGLRRILPYGVGALTAVLTGACLAIACAAWSGYQDRVLDELLLTRVEIVGTTARWNPGLPEIFKEGEFWRLITPALVHLSMAHLLLNLIWLLNLGSLIEAKQGTGRLGILFVTIAIGSNLAQALWAGPYFVGVSGVLYGLLGYIWMKGKFDPDCGLTLHPYTVILMLIVFVLGFGDLFTVAFGVSMANGAHASGLILGVLWGVLTSIPAIRRRRKVQG